MSEGEGMNDKEIDDLIKMIDGKMEEGVGRLKVNFTEAQDAGTVKEQHHLGRCDVGSPWAKGTVTNCDAIDFNPLGEESRVKLNRHLSSKYSREIS